MKANTPNSGDDYRLVEGSFSAADAAALTNIPPASLQHWTNKGYLGEAKLGLGRGARRMYSARDIEVLAVGNELVQCGFPPNTALRCADVTISKADAVLARDMAPTVRQARKSDIPEDIENKLLEYLPLLIATVRINFGSVDEGSVQILTEGRFSLNKMFPDARPAIFIPIGITKITVGGMLEQIKLRKKTKHRSTKRKASA
jgi:DNA-binding transcriptional MerR regulator